jgi:hypothetical protein
MIAYCNHAYKRMLQYGISYAEVEQVIADPAISCPGPNGRRLVKGAVKERVITVIYEIEDNETVVVTVYPEEGEDAEP